MIARAGPGPVQTLDLAVAANAPHGSQVRSKGARPLQTPLPVAPTERHRIVSSYEYGVLSYVRTLSVRFLVNGRDWILHFRALFPSRTSEACSDGRLPVVPSTAPVSKSSAWRRDVVAATSHPPYLPCLRFYIEHNSIIIGNYLRTFRGACPDPLLFME